MSSSVHRRLRVALLVAAAGTLFQSAQSGCANYFQNAALSGIDLCAILNCSGSTFFNFCTPVQILSDCPPAAQ